MKFYKFLSSYLDVLTTIKIDKLCPKMFILRDLSQNEENIIFNCKNLLISGNYKVTETMRSQFILK